MPDTSRSDRARGVLLGLACGDALGAPLEFRTAADIRREYGGPLRDLVGGGGFNWAPGAPTDDTDQALLLARSLDERGDWDPGDFARRLMDWGATANDVGILTRQALRLLSDGDCDWREAGVRAWEDSGRQSAGNGSLMRCAPVALRYLGDAPRIVEVSLEQSAITHADPRCTWACAALNLAIATLIETGDPSQISRDWSLIDDPDVRDVLESAPGMTTDAVRTSGYVLHALGAALWHLHHDATLEGAIINAANRGDDADTTAAITGALAGALHGASALPARWLDVLVVRDEAIELADRLASKAVAV